jgi:hypothetical protein
MVASTIETTSKLLKFWEDMAATYKLSASLNTA